MKASDVSAISAVTSHDASRSSGPWPSPLDRLPGPVLAGLTLVVYLCGAQLCLRLTVPPENIAPIWPINAIVVAIMARRSRKCWHWVLIGQALASVWANLAAPISGLSVFAYTVGNVLVALLATSVLTLNGTQRIDFTSARHAFRLLVVAGPVVAISGAAVAGANFYFARTPHFMTNWWIWSAANGLGMLVVLPTLLSFQRREFRQTSTLFATEVCCLLGSFIVIAIVLFAKRWPVGLYIVNRPLLFTVPFLLWFSLRTSVFVMSATAAALCIITIIGTSLGRGPFIAAESTVPRAIALLQLTLMAWTSFGLIIAVVVSENRRTLEMATHERERFRQLTENIGEVFWMVTLGAKEMMYVSPAYEKVWGRTCESVMSDPRSFVEAIHLDDRDRVIKSLPTQETAQPFSNEYRVVRPDGSIRWVYDRGFPVKDAKGRVMNFAGVALDITDQKQFQKALLEANEFNSQILSSIQDGIIVMDRAMRYRFWSPAMERISGLAAADVLGRTAEELLPFLISGGMKSMWERVLAGESFSTPEAPYEVTQTGRKGWVWRVMSPLRSADGTIVGIIIAIRDITERKAAEDSRKQAEEMLSQSRERFEVLSAATFEGICISENGQIVDCNEQFADIYGYQRGELIGTPIERLIAPQHQHQVSARIANGQATNMEHASVQKDGSKIIVEARGRVISYSGRSVQITALRDVTHRVQMEEIAIQSEKMLSIGGLAAGMAHEINNPLAIMMQNSEVIANRINSNSPQDIAATDRAGSTLESIQGYLKDREIIEMLKDIRKAGDRAAGIVKNMLAFSQPTTVNMGLHRLDELINQTLELTRSDYDLKKRHDLGRLEIVRDFDRELPPVTCHGSEMQQVLLNLLKNAVQASGVHADVGPRIVVRTRRKGDYARIEIEDNGPGMSESVRRRVFEPFFTTKSPGEGIGLGLFVSYFIISQHHKGTISANQSAAGGTCFEINLPLKRSAPATGAMNG